MAEVLGQGADRTATRACSARGRERRRVSGGLDRDHAEALEVSCEHAGELGVVRQERHAAVGLVRGEPRPGLPVGTLGQSGNE
jgi:hypothetical protein